MPEFVELQLYAKDLPERISGLKKASPPMFRYLTFFQVPPLDEDGLNDIQTISLLAESLDDMNNRALICYLQDFKEHGYADKKERLDFKTQALIGCYILKWRKYDSEKNPSHKSLLDFFRKDLGIKLLSDWKEEYIDSCLEAFGIYCSFVCKNSASSAYSRLNEYLKDSIQLEIHNARFPQTSVSCLFYDILSTGMQAVGIKQ